MLTRQFLISHVIFQLRRNSPSRVKKTDKVPATSDEEREKIVQFSDACVQSAHLMVELCYDAYFWQRSP